MATGDAQDVTARTWSLLPPWFPDVSPIEGAIVAGWAALAAFICTLLAFAKSQSRIANASGAWLDIISFDYFGLRFPRAQGESDATFRVRIQKEILRPRNTRDAIVQNLVDTTGNSARVIEAFRPADTGAWDECFWDVDTPTTPFRWSSQFPYQIFIETTAPFVAPFGNNPTPTYDVNGFWDQALYLIDPLPSLIGQQVVYDAVNAAKAAGVTAWVKFVAPQ